MNRERKKKTAGDGGAVRCGEVTRYLTYLSQGFCLFLSFFVLCCVVVLSAPVVLVWSGLLCFLLPCG